MCVQVRAANIKNFLYIPGKKKGNKEIRKEGRQGKMSQYKVSKFFKWDFRAIAPIICL